MKKLLALGLACCLPTGLAAEDPADASQVALGTVNMMVIEDAEPLVKDVACARSVAGKAGVECMAVHRAVLTARVQKVSTLRGTGRWM